MLTPQAKTLRHGVTTPIKRAVDLCLISPDVSRLQETPVTSAIRIATPPTPQTLCVPSTTPLSQEWRRSIRNEGVSGVSASFLRLLRLARVPPELATAVIQLGRVGEQVLRPVLRRLSEGTICAAKANQSRIEWERLTAYRDAVIHAALMHLQTSLLVPGGAEHAITLPPSLFSLLRHFEQTVAAAGQAKISSTTVVERLGAITWHDDDAEDSTAFARDACSLPKPKATRNDAIKNFTRPVVPKTQLATAPAALVALTLKKRMRGNAQRDRPLTRLSPTASCRVADLFYSKLQAACVKKLAEQLTGEIEEDWQFLLKSSEAWVPDCKSLQQVCRDTGSPALLDAQPTVSSLDQWQLTSTVRRRVQSILGSIWDLIAAVGPAGPADDLLQRGLELGYSVVNGDLKRWGLRKNKSGINRSNQEPQTGVIEGAAATAVAKCLDENQVAKNGASPSHRAKRSSTTRLQVPQDENTDPRLTPRSPESSLSDKGTEPPLKKQRNEARSFGILELMGAKTSRKGKYVSRRALANKIKRGKEVKAAERERAARQQNTEHKVQNDERHKEMYICEGGENDKSGEVRGEGNEISGSYALSTVKPPSTLKSIEMRVASGRLSEPTGGCTGRDVQAKLLVPVTSSSLSRRRSWPETLRPEAEIQSPK